MVNADKPPLYIVMTAQTQTQTSKGIHRTVAVVKTNEETYPKLLALRARGVVDIAWRSPPLRTCKTHRGAYQAALAYAQGLATDLNRDQLLSEKNALLARVTNLESLLGLNRSNNGKPPTSAGLKKPPRFSSLREPSGKKTVRRTE